MARYGKSRSAPIILILVIMVVAVAAIISLAKAIFVDNGSNKTTKTDISRQELLSTTNGHKVRMTVRGAIVADETFSSYRIEVTPSSRSLVTYNGYLERQVKAINLDNNVKAYEEFVNALDKADLAEGTPLEDEKDDTKGICATGLLYEFEIINSEGTVKRLWTSTCKGSPGSLDASVDQLSKLFIEQIPDGSTAIKELDV